MKQHGLYLRVHGCGPALEGRIITESISCNIEICIMLGCTGFGHNGPHGVHFSMYCIGEYGVIALLFTKQAQATCAIDILP